MQLTEEQINYGAKYLTADNTGLVGLTVQRPKNKQQIDFVFGQISDMYAQEMGKGLEDELKMWKQDLIEISEYNEERVNRLKQLIPFLFEEDTK